MFLNQERVSDLCAPFEASNAPLFHLLFTTSVQKTLFSLHNTVTIFDEVPGGGAVRGNGLYVRGVMGSGRGMGEACRSEGRKERGMICVEMNGGGIAFERMMEGRRE